VSEIKKLSEASGYQVVYADPPWRYSDKCTSGKRGVEFKYSTMSISQIKSLPVKRLTDPNSVCFLWVTAPLLDKGIDVLSSWGFQYKTIAFVWIKTAKNGGLAWGMGNWTRANAELVLMGVRGKIKRDDAGVHQVVMEPRGEHSQKPVEVINRIDLLLPRGLRKIEIFSRKEILGWDQWGGDFSWEV